MQTIIELSNGQREAELRITTDEDGHTTLVVRRAGYPEVWDYASPDEAWENLEAMKEMLEEDGYEERI